MEKLDKLYHQGLLEIAQKIQREGFTNRSVWYARRLGGSAIVLSSRITARVRATEHLRAALMTTLSKSVTSESQIKRINQTKLYRHLGFAENEFAAFFRGGMESLMSFHLEQLASPLIKLGVSACVARNLIAYVIQQRGQVIKYLNAVDDTGIDIQSALSPPDH